MRTKTQRSAKLWSSLWAPAIQYSHSGEAIASDHRGSSSNLVLGSRDPSVMADSMLSMVAGGISERSRGRRECKSRKGVNSVRKAEVCSSK